MKEIKSVKKTKKVREINEISDAAWYGGFTVTTNPNEIPILDQSEALEKALDEYKKSIPTYKEAVKSYVESASFFKKRPLDSYEHPPLYEEEHQQEQINEEEECIINMEELADHYAVLELSTKYSDFTIEAYTIEYSNTLQKHIDIIKNFKRSKNG